ncbi:MAG TPA: ferrous iron transport protein A [Dongiaceae bacterium]|nr:ferrous iron transport protein A [Dongiaceae bacterium]
MGGPIPLLALSVGVSAHIAEPPPGSEIPRRLGDLGFVPGTELRIVRRAPFGDPIELEIRGYRLCLRAEQIAGLRVTPAGGNGAP